MGTKKQATKVGDNPVNRGRHEHQCRVCAQHICKRTRSGQWPRIRPRRHHDSSNCQVIGIARFHWRRTQSGASAGKRGIQENIIPGGHDGGESGWHTAQSVPGFLGSSDRLRKARLCHFFFHFSEDSLAERSLVVLARHDAIIMSCSESREWSI